MLTKKTNKNNMNSDYRKIYILYFAIAIFLGYIFDLKYNFTNSSKDTASYIATISELLGLSIALTEIFVLKSISEQIKNSIRSLQSYTDISNISIFLSQTKDDLISGKYGKAILRLERIRNVYQENVTAEEISNIGSIHRRNLDKLNSIITLLTITEQKTDKKIKQEKLKEHVSFLTSFNETLVNLKITYKNQIL